MPCWHLSIIMLHFVWKQFLVDKGTNSIDVCLTCKVTTIIAWCAAKICLIRLLWSVFEITFAEKSGQVLRSAQNRPARLIHGWEGFPLELALLDQTYRLQVVPLLEIVNELDRKDGGLNRWSAGFVKVFQVLFHEFDCVWSVSFREQVENVTAKIVERWRFHIAVE